MYTFYPHYITVGWERKFIIYICCYPGLNTGSNTKVVKRPNKTTWCTIALVDKSQVYEYTETSANEHNN